MPDVVCVREEGHYWVPLGLSGTESMCVHCQTHSTMKKSNWEHNRDVLAQRGTEQTLNGALVEFLTKVSNEIHEITKADPSVRLVVPNTEQGEKIIHMMRSLGIASEET